MNKIKLSERQIHAGIIALLLLPPIITAIFIALFGVNVIYWDQWDFFAGTLSHWYTGSLSFQDLFSQHNEHRIFFPRLVMIGIATLTSYNNLAEMVCSYLLLLLILVLIYRIFILGKQWTWKYPMFFIPVAWLVCSLDQYENLLWGFQIQVFLCVTGMLIAILFLEQCKGTDWDLAVGIFGGILSSFSFMNGLMVWPAGLVLLLLKENRSSRAISAWLVAAIVTTLVFFDGWVRQESLPSLFYFIAKPVDAISYFLVIIANSSGFSPGIIGDNAAIFVAVIFLLILCFVLYRAYDAGIIRTNAGIVALIVFPLLSEVMLTVGRGGFGIGQAISPRYITFTVFGIIGLYILFVNLREYCKDDLWVNRVYYFFCLLVLAGIILGMMNGLVQGEKTKEQRLVIRENLISYQTVPDSAFKNLYPDPKVIREWAPVLKKYQLNVFAGNNTLSWDKF